MARFRGADVNVAESDPLLQVFAAQKAGNARRRLDFGLAERRKALGALGAAIKRHEGELTRAMSQDFGKPAHEVLLTEFLPAYVELGHARRHLRRWMRPKRVYPGLVTLGTSGRIVAQPRGTCLIIGTWNYPLLMVIGPLISCLAAGNSAIIKPSELAPATSALVARLVSETFPPELVFVAEGGPEVAQKLLALPFDHIFFTGSAKIGQIVMAAAAKTLASVTLEMGGKCPTVIGPDADLARAARWIAFGKFSNAGQTCIAPDHIFVHETVREPFVAALRAEIGRTYMSGRDAQHMARVINAAHASRLAALLSDAVAKGARVILGGSPDGTRFPPTLIEAVTPEMTIDQQEIFGPILPIIGFDDLSQVIDQIDSRPPPLSLYVFSRDKGFVARLVDATRSGHVGVNLTNLQFSHVGLPFGGVNQSGLGAAHGVHGFWAFSHQRGVLVNRFSSLPLLMPPVSWLGRRLVPWIRRIIG